ncbi:MAG: DUF3078 domain-containing protein [Elusimicrobiota bacterium]|nr:DUF3078 domain-containing protein [Elusimicrobiota bacterium]
MKKHFSWALLFAAFAILSLAPNLQAAVDETRGWQIELRKISLNLTSTQVKHADEYKDFSNSRLTADTQTLIQGYFDFGTDYHAEKYLWSNTLLMQYGKSTIKPVNGVVTRSENVDSITLSTDYAYKLWQANTLLGGFYSGPFANASYDTEFTSQQTSPRKKTLRGKAGYKFFDGKFIKNLYAAGVFEEDFTYPDNSFNFALEAGMKIEQPIREGVKAVYTGTFRDYMHYGVSRETNLDYELELDARMEVLVYKNLAISPFVNYYIAQAKYFGDLGQNLYMGISFSFSTIFKKAKSVNDAN